MQRNVTDVRLDGGRTLPLLPLLTTRLPCARYVRVACTGTLHARHVSADEVDGPAAIQDAVQRPRGPIDVLGTAARQVSRQVLGRSRVEA